MIWVVTFAAFTIFFISQSVFARFGWKLYPNLAKNQGYKTVDSVRSEPVLTGPKTAVRTGPILNKLEGPGPFKDQDRS